MIKILLDTNLLIYRENHSVIDENIQNLTFSALFQTSAVDLIGESFRFMYNGEKQKEDFA